MVFLWHYFKFCLFYNLLVLVPVQCTSMLQWLSVCLQEATEQLSNIPDNSNYRNIIWPALLLYDIQQRSVLRFRLKNIKLPINLLRRWSTKACIRKNRSYAYCFLCYWNCSFFDVFNNNLLVCHSIIIISRMGTKYMTTVHLHGISPVWVTYLYPP